MNLDLPPPESPQAGDRCVQDGRLWEFRKVEITSFRNPKGMRVFQGVWKDIGPAPLETADEPATVWRREPCPASP